MPGVGVWEAAVAAAQVRAAPVVGPQVPEEASVVGRAVREAQVPEPGATVRLRAGDAVRVEIEDEPGLSGEFPVGQDGRVLFPLLGFVAVANRPFDEVRREVEAGYAAELVHPVVRLTPLVRLAVLGEVRRPGLFPVDPTYTVGDVLALAGGLGPAADPRRIAVVRGGEVLVTRLDPDFAIFALAPRSGDQIVVGRRGWLRENLAVFVGAVASVSAAALTALLVR